MSYVIQNFYDCSKIIVKTPRLNFFFILNNLSKFFIFIKTNLFFRYTEKKNHFDLTYFFLFFKYFYAKEYFKKLYKTNLNLVSYYLNNLTKSSAYWIFANILKFINAKQAVISFFRVKPKLLFNLYLTPIRTTNVIIGKSNSKILFFFNLLNFSFIWYQHNSNFNFHLNFILTSTSLTLLKFYSGYFFKIYNF